MRFRAVAALVIVGCSNSYDSPDAFDASTLDAGAGTGATSSKDGGTLVDDASNHVDASQGSDAGAPNDIDAGPPPPFASYLVLRVESDAANGLQANGAWRDLSPHGQSITIASGSPTTQAIGDAGARAMVFDTNGPIFDVPDSTDMRFGATDDFFIVARATLAVPLSSDSSCSFHYLFSKYDPDGGSTGPQMRVCAPSTGRQLIGSINLVFVDDEVDAPTELVTTYDVLSFGRNLSGTRIETYGAGQVLEKTVSTVDVSSGGSAFVVGGARDQGTGVAFGSYIGNIQRMYVYHAPPGTFAKADFDTIRAFVSNPAPL